MKEKELERSDGVLLFLPLIERSASHSEFRFFSFFVCFFLFDERIFVFVREWRERSRIFVYPKEERKMGSKKKRRGHGTKNEQILSLSERTNTISHHFSRQIIKEWD